MRIETNSAMERYLQQYTDGLISMAEYMQAVHVVSNTFLTAQHTFTRQLADFLLDEMNYNFIKVNWVNYRNQVVRMASLIVSAEPTISHDRHAIINALKMIYNGKY